jgi:hypothetical protein
VPQWAYTKIDLNGVSTKTDDVHLLNVVGNDGWELVGVAANNIAYLKRTICAMFARAIGVTPFTCPNYRLGTEVPTIALQRFGLLIEELLPCRRTN